MLCQQHLTLGGPLFHLPSLAVEENVPKPFEAFEILNHLHVLPALLGPTSPGCTEVAASVADLSDQVWIESGFHMEPDVDAGAPPAAGGRNPEAVRAVVEPLVSKDEKCPVANGTASKHLIFLACQPLAGSATPNQEVVVATLANDFPVCLSGIRALLLPMS